MSHPITQTIDLKINKYKQDYNGEIPLYIIVSPGDAELLYEEIRRIDDYGVDVLVTSYKDIKIVTHDSLNPGNIRLTNELPETGS